MNDYSPKEYWFALAENFCSPDIRGLGPVLHPGAPSWFNRLIDRLQLRAVRRALALADLQPGSSILDVGCGTGRWIRRYQELGFRATGTDATAAMLRLAREQGTVTSLVIGEASRLPFAGAKFDAVSDTTVVQHIPSSLHAQVLSEMARVLRPGGRLILMEVIRGKGGHVFSRSPQDWIQQAASCGLKLIGWFGQEFLLLDRIFVRVAQTVGGKKGNSTSIPLAEGPRKSPSVPRRAYWHLRHVTAPLSAWVDPAAEKVCAAQLATHGVFVFRK
ncbi:MAG: class I SAM-dependent methyltransferase [Candidatus Acidiferrales bacterium]